VFELIWRIFKLFPSICVNNNKKSLFNVDWPFEWLLKILCVFNSKNNTLCKRAYFVIKNIQDIGLCCCKAVGILAKNWWVTLVISRNGILSAPGNVKPLIVGDTLCGCDEIAGTIGGRMAGGIKSTVEPFAIGGMEMPASINRALNSWFLRWSSSFRLVNQRNLKVFKVQIVEFGTYWSRSENNRFLQIQSYSYMKWSVYWNENLNLNSWRNF
jgi:hypothetical protein